MKIFFVSKNSDKIKEMKLFFEESGHEITSISLDDLFEIQTINSDKLVKDKTMKAFALLQKPVFVEHTYLKIKEINDFPGGLTSSFWDALKADLICKYFGKSKAQAETVICYCDSKNVFNFKGTIDGVIAEAPAGESSFQWDTIFIPESEKQTFAEMGSLKKNQISMRKKAVDKLLAHLRSGNG